MSIRVLAKCLFSGFALAAFQGMPSWMARRCRTIVVRDGAIEAGAAKRRRARSRSIAVANWSDAGHRPCDGVLPDRTPSDAHSRGPSMEEDMRSLLLGVAASAGLGLVCLAASPASSITIARPTDARQAVDSLNLTEAVHCRRYAHWHRQGHDWSRGCGVDTVVTDPQPSSGVARAGVGSSAPRLGAPATAGRSPGNVFNPSNPQDRSGSSNRQDMTQPRAFNPQDMR